jgi:hypothetical protein
MDDISINNKFIELYNQIYSIKLPYQYKHYHSILFYRCGALLVPLFFLLLALEEEKNNSATTHNHTVSKHICKQAYIHCFIEVELIVYVNCRI